MEKSAPNEFEITIPVRLANVYSFVFFFLAIALYGIPFAALWGLEELIQSFTSFLSAYLILLLSLVAGIGAHELLHALTWAAFSLHGWRSVKFGFDIRNFAPFVHCEEYLSKPHYLAGVIMPGLMLGILPGAISVFSGNGWLLWFGIFFTAGAAGDVLSLIKLFPLNANVWVKDHPDHLGFIVREH